MPRSKDINTTGPRRGSNITWKEKLTQEQLERKRAADRQLVRESRHRTRRTIQTLEEQVRLLSSQQSNQVVSDLIRENKQWEEKHDALMARLYTICSALGLNKENAHNLLAQGQEKPHSAGSGVNAAPECCPTGSANDREITRAGELVKEPFDLRMELDARVRIPGSTSPFPIIQSIMKPNSTTHTLSEEEFLGSIMLWQQSWHPYVAVYDIACNLFHIDRPPSCMSKPRLRRLAHHSDTLQRIVDMLNMSSAIPTDPLPDPEGQAISSSVPTDHPSLETVRRELIICTFESVRYWDYCSREARVAMFWALYRILSLLVLPTSQNLAKCPAWYRPTLSQMSHDHPSFIDFIPWPHIREHLVQNWQNYTHSNLYSSFVESFDIKTEPISASDCLLSLSVMDSELVLHSPIDKCLGRVSYLTANESFLSKFPEFADGIRFAPSLLPTDGLPGLASEFGAELLEANSSLLQSTSLPTLDLTDGASNPETQTIGDDSYLAQTPVDILDSTLPTPPAVYGLSDQLSSPLWLSGILEPARVSDHHPLQGEFVDESRVRLPSEYGETSHALDIDFKGRIFLV